jgi:ribosomal protein S18 acetylase RimI-like enzyme
MKTQRQQDAVPDPGVTGLENVVVRLLDPEDLDAIVRIDARRSGRRRREFYERRIREVTRDSDIKIGLVAEIDGAVAGFLLGRLYFGEFGVPEPLAIIDAIGVDPGFAGRHAGGALLSQLETNLRAIGVEKIRTHVEWKLFELIRFLGGKGFEPVPILCLEKTTGHAGPSRRA